MNNFTIIHTDLLLYLFITVLIIIFYNIINKDNFMVSNKTLKKIFRYTIMYLICYLIYVVIYKLFISDTFFEIVYNSDPNDNKGKETTKIFNHSNKEYYIGLGAALSIGAAVGTAAIKSGTSTLKTILIPAASGLGFSAIYIGVVNINAYLKNSINLSAYAKLKEVERKDRELNIDIFKKEQLAAKFNETKNIEINSNLGKINNNSEVLNIQDVPVNNSVSSDIVNKIPSNIDQIANKSTENIEDIYTVKSSLELPTPDSYTNLDIYLITVIILSCICLYFIYILIMQLIILLYIKDEPKLEFLKKYCSLTIFNKIKKILHIIIKYNKKYSQFYLFYLALALFILIIAILYFSVMTYFYIDGLAELHTIIKKGR